MRGGSRAPSREIRDETPGWWLAGASEQQEQHELEEESGFMGTRVSGAERGKERRAKEKRDGRAVEEEDGGRNLVGVLAM